MEVTYLTLEQRVICFKAAAVGLIDDDDDLEHELTQLDGYSMRMLAGFVDRIAGMVTEKMHQTCCPQFTGDETSKQTRFHEPEQRQLALRTRSG
jgi:hypothetical protein